MNNLAYGYYAAGKLGKAIPLWEETLEKMKVKLGLDHPLTLTMMNNLGNAYRAAGKHDRSVAILEETLGEVEGEVRLRSPRHPRRNR